MIRKTNSSEVFDIFAKTMISRMAARSPGNLNKVAGQFSIFDDVFEGIMKLFKGDVKLPTLENKALLNDALQIPNHRDLRSVFDPSTNLHKDISSGIEVFTEASPRVRDDSLPELNEIAKRYGFNDVGDAYNTAKNFPEELSALTKSGDLNSFRSERIANAYKFFADPDIKKVLRESEDSLSTSAPVRSTEPAPPDATTPRGESEGAPTSAAKSTDDEIESLKKKIEQAETKSKEVDSAGNPTPAAKAASKEGETLTKQLKDKQNQTWSQWLWRDWTAAATAKSVVSLFAGLIKLSIFGIPLYGIYYFFSSATSSTRDKAAYNIITSKNCLDEINTASGTKAESMKASLSQDLDRLNQMTSLTSGRVTEEFVQTYANLIDKVGGTGEGSIFAFANHLQQNPGELVGGLSAQVSESMSCVVTNFNEAKKIIMSLAAKIVETGRESPGGGRTDAEIPSISGSKNSISGDVNLADGSTHSVVITTRKPSIPPKFILFFQDGRNPLFSSPTFTAFVDPDGQGLVPNAVGKPLAGDGRIAAAIKYCYNNRIKTESDLRRDVIKSINSGLSPLRKLFKNEPEQKAFERMIKKYKRGGGSSSESFSDDHMDINKSSEYQNNLFESINKTSSTMNKLALSNDKITYHEDAVKGLKDKLTKSYYAGLDSMYNEKPKAQKTDLKDLYGFQEETGYDLLMEAHPKSTYLAEAMGDGGLVENGLEQKVKSEAVALSVPSGNFRSKYAETHAYLNKLLKVAEAENKTEVSNLIKQTINQFFN